MEKQRLPKTIRLGKVYITPGAEREISAIDINTAIMRHVCCDWGELCDEDWELNNQAVGEGSRILSAYTSSNRIRFWIITEAGASATTILLPEEY